MNRRFRVLISDPLPAETREVLVASGRIDVSEERRNFLPLLPEIDGWIVRSETKIGADYLSKATKLRCVCRAGAGVDNIDLAAATRHGVVVMNTPDANSNAAAEHTVALLLSLARRIPFAHMSMASGKWERSAFVGVELEGKYAGVVGLGKIGRLTARKLAGLGMNVIGVDPFVSAESAKQMQIELTTLDQMLPEVDFMTLHVPLAEATRGLIGMSQFSRCRRGLRLVNCSRGGVVDEAALVAAIESGHIAGAALDVFATEPLPADSPLRNHPAIVVTPHLGASTTEAQDLVGRLSALQVRDFLIEGKTANAVNRIGLEK